MNFQKDVLQSKKLVLVDFWAEWCGPCKALAPVIDEIEKEYDIKVYKINVDENQDLVEKYSILSLPNVKLFKNGEMVEEITGFRPKTTYVDKIEKYL